MQDKRRHPVLLTEQKSCQGPTVFGGFHEAATVGQIFFDCTERWQVSCIDCLI